MEHFVQHLDGFEHMVPSLSEWSQMLLGLMVITIIGWHFHRERSY
jgi:hypothetical protein